MKNYLAKELVNEMMEMKLDMIDNIPRYYGFGVVGLEREAKLKNVTLEYDEITECAHPNTMDLIAYMGASFFKISLRRRMSLHIR